MDGLPSRIILLVLTLLPLHLAVLALQIADRLDCDRLQFYLLDAAAQWLLLLETLLYGLPHRFVPGMTEFGYYRVSLQLLNIVVAAAYLIWIFRSKSTKSAKAFWCAAIVLSTYLFIPLPAAIYLLRHYRKRAEQVAAQPSSAASQVTSVDTMPGTGEVAALPSSQVFTSQTITIPSPKESVKKVD